MEVKITLKISEKEKDILMDSLDVYSRYLLEESKTSSQKYILELKQETDKMLEQLRTF